MRDIEQALRAALEPKDPSPGFTESVLELVERNRQQLPPRASRSDSFRPYAIPIGIAATLLIALVLGLVKYGMDRTPDKTSRAVEDVVTTPSPAAAAISQSRKISTEKKTSRRVRRNKASPRNEAEIASKQLVLAINIVAAKLHRAQQVVFNEERP